MTTAVQAIAHKAQIRRAQERLGVLDDIRDAARLARDGKTQREIAEILHTTQPRVHRMLRGARALGDAETPEEIILRATVNDTSRDVLVKRLNTFDYTFTKFAPYPHDG